MNKLSDDVWTKGDIKKAVNIISEAKNKKTGFVKSLDKAVYWVSLVVAIIGNLLVAVAIAPVLITVTSFYIYLIIAMIALSFGLLFELIIRDIENLGKVHHLIISLIIPLFAVINFFIIVMVINNLNIISRFSPTGMGLTYAVAFLLPYLYMQLRSE